jgi:hypothetical protein
MKEPTMSALSEAGLAALLARGWTRSRRGNLTRITGDVRLTVFRHDDRYKWCVAVGTDVGCGAQTYDTEQQAATAAMVAVEEEG